LLIQEHKTYFVSSRLHSPHHLQEMESTATFYHINYVNINGVKRKWKNATYFKFLHIKDGVLLVHYRRNGWSQLVGVLIAKQACARCPVSNCCTLSWPPKLTLDTWSHSTVLL